MLYDFILATAVYEGVTGLTAWCVEKAHQEGLRFLWVPGVDGKGDALVGRARSIMCTTFMEHGASDYMIFLDSDIVFEPWHLAKLNEHQKNGLDIVGGMYPLRNGCDWASYWFQGIGPEKQGLSEIQFLSTGFMGISKRALWKIANDYRYPDGSKMPLLHPNTDGMRSYPFFETNHMHMEHPDAHGTYDVWLSEDWDFCQKARVTGYKLWCDSTILLSHQGHRVVTPNDVAQYKTEQQKQEEVRKEDLRKKSEEPMNRFLPEHVVATTEGVNA